LFHLAELGDISFSLERPMFVVPSISCKLYRRLRLGRKNDETATSEYRTIAAPVAADADKARAIAKSHRITPRLDRIDRDAETSAMSDVSSAKLSITP